MLLLGCPNVFEKKTLAPAEVRPPEPESSEQP